MKNHYPIGSIFLQRNYKFYFRLQKYNILFIYTIPTIDFCNKTNRNSHLVFTTGWLIIYSYILFILWFTFSCIPNKAVFLLCLQEYAIAL
jgi:hypothetical protein